MALHCFAGMFNWFYLSKATCCVLAIGVLAALPRVSVQAQDGADFFLRVSGVSGEASAPGFEQWLDVEAAGAELKQDFLVSVPELQFVRPVDSASTELFWLASNGAVANADLVVFQTVGKSRMPFLRIRLPYSLIYQYGVSGEADAAFESFRILPAEIEFSYFFVEEDGSTVSALTRAFRFFDYSELEPDDLDGDGLPDKWEKVFGLPTNFNNSAADSDGDGLTDAEEYVAGTSPVNGGSFLQLQVGAAPLKSVPELIRVSDQKEGDVLFLQWQAIPGRIYRIYRLPDELDGEGVLYRKVTADGDGLIKLELDTGSDIRAFYRLRVEMVAP